MIDWLDRFRDAISLLSGVWLGDYAIMWSYKYKCWSRVSREQTDGGYLYRIKYPLKPQSDQIYGEEVSPRKALNLLEEE